MPGAPEHDQSQGDAHHAGLSTPTRGIEQLVVFYEETVPPRPGGDRLCSDLSSDEKLSLL